MTRMISRMGHEVTSAEDGLICLNLLRDAWEAKDENRYDIVCKSDIFSVESRPNLFAL